MPIKPVIQGFLNARPGKTFVRSMRQLKKRYPSGEDPWGLNLEFLRSMFIRTWPFYKHYFRVKVHGGQNVPEQGAIVVVSNHSGQIAIDGALISLAFFSDVPHPRILRAMVERFVAKIPFIGSWITSCGGVLGDRRNCQLLLEQGEAVLVFPEGVRGIAKNTSEYYQLQHFTTGFFRMALEAGCDILPIAVVGAEEFYPYVYQARSLAKKLGLPALPISPNFFPLPSAVDIYIGEVYKIPPTMNDQSSDLEVKAEVAKIKSQIQDMIDHGRQRRHRRLWLQKHLKKSTRPNRGPK